MGGCNSVSSVLRGSYGHGRKLCPRAYAMCNAKNYINDYDTNALLGQLQTAGLGKTVQLFQLDSYSSKCIEIQHQGVVKP